MITLRALRCQPYREVAPPIAVVVLAFTQGRIVHTVVLIMGLN